jgi:hypothetical protein
LIRKNSHVEKQHLEAFDKMWGKNQVICIEEVTLWGTLKCFFSLFMLNKEFLGCIM